MSDIPYQQKPQVEALKQERANCVAYGNDKRVAQIDRQLADLGVKREAAEARGAAAEDGGKQAPPKGRRGKETSTVVVKDAGTANS